MATTVTLSVYVPISNRDLVSEAKEKAGIPCYEQISIPDAVKILIEQAVIDLGFEVDDSSIMYS